LLSKYTNNIKKRDKRIESVLKMCRFLDFIIYFVAFR